MVFAPASTANSHPARPLDRGDLRVLQAYLRMLGYYGDPAQVRGVDVVDGDAGPRTQRAIARFAADGHTQHAHACGELLEDVRERFGRVFPNARGHGQPWRPLDEAFRDHYRQSPEIWRQLHPAMRFPLLAAIDDLRRQGIPVTLADGRRTRSEQEGHIREGRSTAPPGASFHDHGLAIDLSPRNGLQADHPAWPQIHRTMERYGFYSLFRAQGWDRPHFELPAPTLTMMRWPRDAQGWKQIPESSMPAVWRRINTQSLARLASVDMDEPLVPSLTPRLHAEASAVRRG